MIAALRGILEAKTLAAALVRVGGVTFLVHAPVTTLSQLSSIGAEVTLHTYLHLRQDEIALYGFASADDRQLFETLLGVTGVGPRMGLAILSSMNAEGFRLAVLNGDEQRLTLIPGVSKKLAARLVLELREKLAKMGGVPVPVGTAGAASAYGSGRAEVIEALTGLGYSAASAQMAYSKLPPEQQQAGLEEQIMAVLRYLAKE
jgi:Holliday junction DNA helicase RuvA